MKHPSEATLALFAGHDLGPLARWRIERHLAGCERCRDEVTNFSELRQEMTGLNDLPGIPWNRLAAEMKANIRVGLAAGECVRDVAPALSPLFAGARTAAICASVAILLLAGFWLERPSPDVAGRQPAISLAATRNGIEVRQGDQALVLKNGSAEDRSVTYSAGAQGSIGARYVDPGTGYVTINTVYVQ